MAWTRLDDRWDIGTKMVRAFARLGDAAVCMWSRGVTHCNRDLTDGKIHGDVLRSLTKHRRPQEVIDALVDVGLLDDLGGDSYGFHDFLDWNASRQEIESTREAKRTAGKRGGERSGEARQPKQERSRTEAPASTLLPVCLPSGSPVVNPSPDPIRSSPDPITDPPLVPPSGGPPPAPPAPKPTKAKGPKPATQQPTDDVDPWLAALDVPAVDSVPWGPQVAEWLDHHAAKGSRFADWAAAWRTWSRNAVKFGHVDVDADPAKAKRSLQASPVQRETLTPRDPEPNPRLEAHMARMVAEGRDTPMPANPLQALLAMASKPPTTAPSCPVAASGPPSTPREASVGTPASPAGDQRGAA